jgi:hypothetical protein
MSRYRVVSIDNDSFSGGGVSRKRGEFDDGEAAIAHARSLVDEALLEHFGSATSAEDLMNYYMTHGSEVPQIFGEPRVAFHAYQYAREKANAMFAATN